MEIYRDTTTFIVSNIRTKEMSREALVLWVYLEGLPINKCIGKNRICSDLGMYERGFRRAIQELIANQLLIVIKCAGKENEYITLYQTNEQCGGNNE